MIYSEDRHMVERAVMSNGLALQYASPEVRDILFVVEEAILNNPMAIQYASSRIQNDQAILIELLAIRPAMFQYIPIRLQNDRPFIRRVLASKARKAYLYMPMWVKDDIDMAILMAYMSPNVDLLPPRYRDHAGIIGIALTDHQYGEVHQSRRLYNQFMDL